MNETESKELYQTIFSEDRIERWKVWERHGPEKEALPKGCTHPLAETPLEKHRWSGGVTYYCGYRRILVPSHPRADVSRYVSEHILAVEISIGRFLEKEEVVHHINENKLDNRISNLMLLKNRREHNILHRRMRALKECGNSDWLRCSLCKTWDSPENLYVRRGGNREAQARHRECRRKPVADNRP